MFRTSKFILVCVLIATTLRGNNFGQMNFAYWQSVAAAGVVASGGTATSGNSYNQWSFTTTGSNTFTVTTGGTVYYAIVGGGGGGGYGLAGGGGGGGVVLGQSTLTAGTYTIIVGSGGSTGTSTTGGVAGGNSSAFGFTAVGGGGGASSNGSGGIYVGNNGGSGGGISSDSVALHSGYVGVAGQGWQGGGNGIISTPYPSGGGGGAGGIGATGTSIASGNGGTGLSVYLPVSNTTVYYGGGGGGGGGYLSNPAGTGGTGGGGNGGFLSTGTAGTTNTGGGGGGGGYTAGYTAGGNGGSGIVVIWSPIATPAKTPYVQYLAVAGGGSGGVRIGGGGGAGGVLQGIAQITAGATYTVAVGNGGAAVNVTVDTQNLNGNNGSNTTITGTGFSVTAIGGGGGAGTDLNNGSSGGSGGGGARYTPGLGGSGTLGQGYAGAPGATGAIPDRSGGGGGYGMLGYSGTVGASGGDGFTPSFITNQSWSSKFNGSTDYLTVTNSATIGNFGTGDFTVEEWIFVSSIDTTNGTALIDFRPTSTNTNAILGINTSYQLFWQVNGSTAITGAALSLNTWYHVAVVRSSGSTKMYLNGTQTGSTYSDSNSYAGGTNRPYINRTGYSSSAVALLGGYTSNLRIVSGTAVYTSSFTPPTAPLTAISGTQLLTCQNSGFIDNSSNAFAVTPTGASPATYNPFAPIANTTYSWSNNFNSTGYFTVPSSSNLTFGTNDFTIEFWMFSGNTALEQPIGTGWNGNTGEWTLFVNQGSYPNKIAFFNYYSSGSNRAALVSTSNINNNTWYHVAITRKYSTSTMYMFINGALQATDTSANSGGLNFSSTGLLSCGAYYYAGGFSNFWQGYISNLRIVNGTCLYTSSFTPSTTPLTAITNTQLLTCQSPTFVDNSSNNFTLTTAGSPYITSQNPFGASYAGGGGGSGLSYSGGFEGMGGGGLGATAQAGVGTAAGSNTGSGGGGGGFDTSNYSKESSFAGGSGIVILAYPSTYPAASSVTGSPTVTTTGGYRVYTFTGGGTITF